MGLRSRLAVLAAAPFAVSMSLTSLPSTAAAATSPPPTEPAAVVSLLTTAKYGQVLVVGGTSELAGTPLYAITSDADGIYGCTTAKAQSFEGTLSCTGPESDFINGVQSDDWPAFTSPNGTVTAGPGVDASLLGVVSRAGIGDQVTYAGHPLYLFDPPSHPFTPAGENFAETTQPLPPWHGIWYLLDAAGAFAPEQATLFGEIRPNGTSDLAADEYSNVQAGGVAFTVYTLSGDSPGVSRCTGICARSWMPVITTGAPLSVGGVTGLGEITRSDGTTQVTYHGMPLYFYSSEVITVTSDGPIATGTTANGEGVASPGDGTASVVPLNPLSYVGLVPAPGGKGYYLATTSGLLDGYGNAAGISFAAGTLDSSGIVGGATSGQGGYLVGADGGVFALGDPFYGSATGFDHAPIVAMAATPDGKGYWLVASDGGVFAYGDATFAGAAAGFDHAPIVGMVPTADGKGYWLVASDGGVFAYGDATFHGSAYGLDQGHITGLAATPDGQGYWLVGSDGGVFTFGDAAFHGSAYGTAETPVVGLAATPDGGGYWITGADGGVFTYGDAPFYGSGG